MNPVLLRELRGRMRGRRAFLALGLFVLIHSLVFLAIFSFELIPAFEGLGHGSNRLARVGRSLFKGFMALLAVLVALFTPAFTATSLSQERDKKTLDFLRLTLLSPFQIVTGKLIGAFLYVMLLIVTSLPILGVVFFVGGVDLNEILLSYMALGLEALVIGAFCIGLSAQKQTGSLNSAAAYFISIMGLWAVVPIVIEGTQHNVPWYGWDLPIMLPAVPLVVLSAIFAMHEAANGLKITAYDRQVSARLTALLWYIVAVFTILGWVPWHKSYSLRHLCEAMGAWYVLDGLAIMSAFIFFCFNKPSHIELEQSGLFWHFVPSREILRNRLVNAPWFLLLLSVLGSLILGIHLCVFLPATHLEHVLKLLAHLTIAKAVTILAFGHLLVSVTLFVRLLTAEPLNAFLRCVIVTIIFFAIVVLPAFVMVHYHHMWRAGTFTYVALCFLASLSPFSPLRMCHENMVPRHAKLTLADISLFTKLPPWIVHVIIYGLLLAVFVILARRLKTRVAKEVLGKAIIVFFALHLFSASTFAASLTVHLREGLGQVVRAGSWYPLEVVVRADSEGYQGALTIKTSEGHFSRKLNLPPRGMKRHVLYVQGRRHKVEAEGLHEDEIVLFARNTPKLTGDSFFVVLISPSEEHGSLEFLKLISPSRSSSSAAQTVVVPLTRRQLPNSFLGYDGVDVIVLGNEDYEQFTQEQNKAIEQYVMRGGTVIVPGGVKPERFRRSPLKELFPGKLVKTKQMKSLSLLVHQFKRAEEDLPTQVERSFLVTLCEPKKDARVVYKEANFPVVVERHEGSGRVVFLAFDVQKSPLALQSLGWLRLRLWRLLLPWRGFRRHSNEVLTIAQAWSRQEPIPFSQVRGDLVKQALRIDTVEPPSATLVFCFVLSYIFVVGPLQYVILQRRRRLEWAWVVTPLIAFVYFFVAFLFGSYRLGGQRICRQLTVLSGRANGRNLKEDTFVRLFTDRTDTYMAAPTNCPGLVVPGAYSYRKKEKFLIDSKGVNAGPVRLHVWSERDYISLGLRKNELFISGDFTLDGTVLKGVIKNGGTSTLRRVCFVTSRSYAFLKKKDSVLAPGEKKNVELQLYSLSRFGQRPAMLKNLQEFENSKLVTELIDELDPTELYMLAFLNDNKRPVQIEPKVDQWNARTVISLQMNIHRQLGTAFIHSPKRVNVWCRYENRSGRKKPVKGKSQQWQRHETVETSVDSATRIYLRADFPDLDENIEVDEVEVIFYKRRGSCNINVYGPQNRQMTETFTSWRDDYRKRVIVVPQKFLSKDKEVELSIESDGHNSVHLGNIRFLLRGRRRAP